MIGTMSGVTLRSLISFPFEGHDRITVDEINEMNHGQSVKMSVTRRCSDPKPFRASLRPRRMRHGLVPPSWRLLK